jgi:cytochrome c peroxidase
LSGATSACQEAGTGVDDGPSTVTAFAKGGGGGSGPPSATLIPLGERLFQDRTLSLNENQSCQSCHEPTEGFAASLTGVPTRGSVVEGSVPGRFGDRKPPSAAYASLAPLFTSSGNNASGGNFWDGRATGARLGNPAADQALGPFLNPKEQALPDEACVVWKVVRSTYGTAFATAWSLGLASIAFPADVGAVCSDPTLAVGEPVALSASDRLLVHRAYEAVARTLAAYESSLNVFDSRRDAGLLTAIELEGQKIFSSKGKCGQCHDYKGSRPLYTEFEFHNLGVPRNRANPVYGASGFDPGLGGFTGNPAHLGKFRTPTLRNVALGSNRTYMHNGALVSLRQVVQFYSTRDVLPVCTEEAQLLDPARWGPDGDGCWPPPEYPRNLDTQSMGNLGLTDHEVDALVAFMGALTDRGIGN